jgi:hypothetical protein
MSFCQSKTKILKGLVGPYGPVGQVGPDGVCPIGNKGPTGNYLIDIFKLGLTGLNIYAGNNVAIANKGGVNVKILRVNNIVNFQVNTVDCSYSVPSRDYFIGLFNIPIIPINLLPNQINTFPIILNFEGVNEVGRCIIPSVFGNFILLRRLNDQLFSGNGSLLGFSATWQI